MSVKRLEQNIPLFFQIFSNNNKHDTFTKETLIIEDPSQQSGGGKIFCSDFNVRLVNV